VHILTKVFVLIAAVLSIMMASLAIAYSVNVDRVTADYRDMQAAKLSAEAELIAQRSTHGQERAALEEDLTSLRDELASRNADTRRLEAATTDLRIKLRQAEAARESISARISQLGVTTETQARIIDEYKNENDRLRDDELAYRDEKIDLEKAISDLESQVIVYEQVKRALQEQIAEMQRESTGSAIASDNGNNDIVTEMTQLVRGSIDQVMNDPNNGNTRVRINLGSNDRVSPNTRLYIIRDNTVYLGDMIIESVDLNHAVGRIAFVKDNQSVREGDQVLSRLGS
jgi:transcription initiation factor IIF auxiliary subunit